MYQRVGTDIGRTLDPNIWIKNAQMFINNSSGRAVVITDCRFSNEAYWIKNQGGYVIHIKRNSKLIAENSHSSERGMTERDYDYTIYNTKKISDLYKKIDEFMNKIKQPGTFLEN